MATRRRYTPKQRTKVAGLAAVVGVTEAERQTGIPKETIHYWVTRPEFAHLRTKTQEERAEGFQLASTLALARLIELIPVMEPRDLIVLAGVTADKGQLLSGHATDRTEHRDLTDKFDDHEKEILGTAIRGELARRADERAAEAAMGTPGETGAEGPAG